MKAVKVTICDICRTSINRGDDIAKFCGGTVHAPCKRRRLNELRSQPVTEVPYDPAPRAMVESEARGTLARPMTPTGRPMGDRVLGRRS